MPQKPSLRHHTEPSPPFPSPPHLLPSSLEAMGEVVGPSARTLSPHAKEGIRLRSQLPKPKQIVTELGPTSPAGRAKV